MNTQAEKNYAPTIQLINVVDTNAIAALPGIVISQAVTICLHIFHRTACFRRVAPAPIIEGNNKRIILIQNAQKSRIVTQEKQRASKVTEPTKWFFITQKIKKS